MPTTKTKPTTAAQPLADPTDGDRVVLEYTGPKVLVDAPAHDLTPADIARMVFLEGLREGMQDGIRPDPRDPDQEKATEIVERLVARGAYRVPSATETITANPDNAPADPATPEG